MKRQIFVLAVLIAGLLSCSRNDGFISTEDGHFVRDGKPYWFVGANYWCGPVLGSPGKAGDRERLSHDLDVLKAAGVDNLRVLVGADENCRENKSIIPYLQGEPGELDPDLLEGLDYFMAELGKRGMTAVLYFNNHCPWSGGYTYYVKKVTGIEPPRYGTAEYGEYASLFVSMREAQELFLDHVRTMVSRTNSITGKAYKDDPAIFSWQIANEPRAFRDELHPQFTALMHEAAQLIRSIDPNHMISSGMEGMQGCENLPREYEDVHSDPLISYLTFHIWPDNWGFKDLYGDSRAQLEAHLDVARKLGKPLVVEEFGLLRDLENGERCYDFNSPTTHRDEYYSWIFDLVCKSASVRDNLAGANFWAFAGGGRQRQVIWEEGDPLIGDPPFEPQGMFSVYDCDTSTLNTVSAANEKIAQILEDSSEEQIVSISNGRGMEAKVSNVGPRIVELSVPDRDGKVVRLVSGSRNPGNFDKACSIVKTSASSVGFKLPGSGITLSYRLTRTGKLNLEYEGKSRKEMVLDDRIGFNCGNSARIADNHLWVNAPESPFYNRRRICSEVLPEGGTYCWNLNTGGDSGKVAACLSLEDNGIEVKVFTDEPMIQYCAAEDGTSVILNPCRGEDGLRHLNFPKGKEGELTLSYYFYCL